MVIDCHCRAGNASLIPYLRRADHAGIDRTVLFASFKSNYAAANADVARLMSLRPDRFIGFVCIHCGRDRGRVRTLVREAVQAHGFRGIAVHRLDAALTREVCEAAMLFGVPVVYDVMGDVSPMEVIAEEYPAVDFILPHLGSVAGDGQDERALLDLIEHKPNVHVDTAGTQRFDFLEEAIARAGAKKVLFGSGGPLLHPGLELAKVLLLKLKPEDHRRVVGGNLLRLISGRSVRREHGIDGIATPRPVRIGDVDSEAYGLRTQTPAQLQGPVSPGEVLAGQGLVQVEDEPLVSEVAEEHASATVENASRASNVASAEEPAHVADEPLVSDAVEAHASARGEDAPPEGAQAEFEPASPAPTVTPLPVSVEKTWAGTDTVTTSLSEPCVTLVIGEAAKPSPDRIGERPASTTSIAFAEAASGHDSISASLAERVEVAPFDPDALSSTPRAPVESAAPGP